MPDSRAIWATQARVKEFAEQVSIFTLVKIGSDGFSLFLQAESLSGLNIIAQEKSPVSCTQEYSPERCPSVNT